MGFRRRRIGARVMGGEDDPGRPESEGDTAGHATGDEQRDDGEENKPVAAAPSAAADSLEIAG